jgi:tetratricopeptide (TPR) repeat protein
MALAWTGLPVTMEDMVPQVYTPGKEGTLANDMVTAARRNGRLAVRLNGLTEILGEIAAGHPVLVFQNLSLDAFPLWHFALAVGYDLESRSIILHSGRDRNRVTALDVFEHTWARSGYWALAVLPAGTLPATAGEKPVLRAAAGLERAGQPRAAATSYRRIAERWPDSLPALIGIGNARYATGDLDDAEQAFRRATQRHPGAAAAWNNLAHVLGRNGRQSEAMDAARRAVRLAGAESGPYTETLRELQGVSN